MSITVATAVVAPSAPSSVAAPAALPAGAVDLAFQKLLETFSSAATAAGDDSAPPAARAWTGAPLPATMPAGLAAHRTPRRAARRGTAPTRRSKQTGERRSPATPRIRRQRSARCSCCRCRCRRRCRRRPRRLSPTARRPHECPGRRSRRRRTQATAGHQRPARLQPTSPGTRPAPTGARPPVRPTPTGALRLQASDYRRPADQTNPKPGS